MKFDAVGEVKFPEIDIEITNNLVKDTNLYDDPRTQNEYSLLLDAAFNLVDGDVREVVYNWIASGPNIDEFKSSVIKHTDKEPTEIEIASRVNYWEKNRLHLIKKYLNND